MLAITGGKGGCGKTTTTLVLAKAMARQGFDPLVVDADCDMPDVHHRLNIPREPGLDAVASGNPLPGSVRRPDAVAGANVLTGGRRENLPIVLRRAAHWDGPVILDCAAGANPDALCPVRHASHALLVSTDSPQCLEDTERTLTAVRELDTAPVGTIIRNTESRRGPSSGLDIPTLGTVPSVDMPLTNENVARRMSSISKMIMKSVYRDVERMPGRSGLRQPETGIGNQ